MSAGAYDRHAAGYLARAPVGVARWRSGRFAISNILELLARRFWRTLHARRYENTRQLAVNFLPRRDFIPALVLKFLKIFDSNIQHHHVYDSSPSIEQTLVSRFLAQKAGVAQRESRKIRRCWCIGSAHFIADLYCRIWLARAAQQYMEAMASHVAAGDSGFEFGGGLSIFAWLLSTRTTAPVLMWLYADGIFHQQRLIKCQLLMS